MAIANTNTAPILKEGTNITLSQVGQTITITSSAGSAAGGSNTEVQYNSGGALEGDPSFTYNDTTNVVSLESVDFATTPAAADAERRLKWDNDEGSLVLTLKGGNVTIPLGAEVVSLVYNAEATTLAKGEVVYAFGASGQRVSVKRAINTADATSARTFGVIAESIAAGAEGFCMVQGMVRGIDTSAYTQGDPIYLGATAGTFVKTKPVAPNHLVYLGFVVKVNASSGEIFVRPQNGYEMDEIHDYLEGSVQNNDVISYETSSGLYKPKSIATLLGYTPANQATTLTINGTSYDLSANRSWTIGGGSTGTNDLNKSNGSGGFSLSYITSPSNGNLTLGDSTLAGDRIITTDGSATNIQLYIRSKGNGSINLQNNFGGSDTRDISVGQTTISSTNTASATNNATTQLWSDRFYVRKQTANTNTVEYPLEISNQTSGTPAVGIGTGLRFLTQTSGSNYTYGSTIESVSTNITSPTEAFDLVFKTMAGGATASEKIRLISTGQLKLNNYTSTSSFTGTAAGYLAFDSSGNIITTAAPSITETDTLATVTGRGATTSVNTTFNGDLVLTASLNHNGIKTYSLGSFGANGTQARRIEIARIGIDYNDWNNVGTFEVELHENYYSDGLKKVYTVNYGYSNANPILRLVSYTGVGGSNNAQVTVGSPVTVSGDHRYVPVYVDINYYSAYQVFIRTTRNLTNTTNTEVGKVWINTSPSYSNIASFTADSVPDLTSASSATINGTQIVTNSGTWGIKIRGVDNTYANGLLQSGTGRADDSTGDTWIFSDSLGSDSNKWGIKHNQASNHIEIWGNNAKKSYFDQSDGNLYLVGGTQAVYNSGTWNINVTGYSTYLPTLYNGGQQLNPQTYFGSTIGLRVAMTASNFYWNDTLWINGYSGGDVRDMCALHTARNGQPRMWISSQLSDATSYGTQYEFITGWNIGSQSVSYANSAGSVPASGITGQTGMWTSSARPGPYRLYRRDDDSNYSVQTYWTGLNWRLYGYNGDTAHADTQVGYADNAGHSSTATLSDTLAVSYNLTSGLNKQMLWGNGNYVYGCGGIVVDASVASIKSSSWVDYNDEFYTVNGNGTSYLKYVRFGDFASSGETTLSGGGNGWIKIDYPGQVGGRMTFDESGNLVIRGSLTQNNSDERLKNKISNIENALEKVLSLDGFYYTYNELAEGFGFNNEGMMVGLSAQQVQKVLPQITPIAAFDREYDKVNNTYNSKTGQNYLTIQYERLVALLVEAIKEQNKKIVELENKIK